MKVSCQYSRKDAYKIFENFFPGYVFQIARVSETLKSFNSFVKFDQFGRFLASHFQTSVLDDL